MNLFKPLFGPPIPALGPAEAQARLKTRPAPFLLDVRQPEEYKAGHIDGAKLVPHGELNRRIHELPKDRDILCVCRSGHRSGSAARQLLAAGYSAVNLRGGMIGWQMAGLPVGKGK